MGRRAKYLTAASKTAAQRKNESNYSQTESAKLVRATGRRAQHLSSTGRTDFLCPLRCIPHLPRLPREIHHLYHLPLPVTEALYQDALAGASYLDLSDISRWMLPPPFVEDDDQTDPYSQDYHTFTRNLGFVLDGVRMRSQNSADRQRRIDFDPANGRTTCMEALRVEVQQLLRDFEQLDLNIYHEYHASREHAMLQNYAQWQARTIYHLYYLKFLD
ncbi:hypothetical protein DFH06DRAFT_1326466 [Mycena polygramma]|nr:hypothetical protein DFH06DRAFT_1326466 [Mycena polygramma]